MSAENVNPLLVVYRIRNWSRYFENNRSRDLKSAWWVPFPNFMGEDAYAELLDHPDGPAHYGVWAACVQIAAKAQMAGSLVRDGGAPHTADSIARICRMPAGLVRDACARLAVIGWMEQVTVSKDTYLDGAANLRDARGNGAVSPQNAGSSRARVERRGEEKITTPPGPPSSEGGPPQSQTTPPNNRRPRGMSKAEELAQHIYHRHEKGTL